MKIAKKESWSTRTERITSIRNMGRASSLDLSARVDRSHGIAARITLLLLLKTMALQSGEGEWM